MTFSNDDSELSRRERDVLGSLHAVDPPPAGLEDQVVNRLRARGLIRRPASKARAAWIAALLVVSVATFGAGRMLGARQAALVTSVTPGAEFLVLLYEGADFDRAALGQEQARVEEYRTWARELSRTGHLISAGELSVAREAIRIPSTAAASQASSNEPTGYFLIVAADRNEAARLASTCPHVQHGGRVVVRPVV